MSLQVEPVQRRVDLKRSTQAASLGLVDRDDGTTAIVLMDALRQPVAWVSYKPENARKLAMLLNFAADRQGSGDGPRILVP